MALKDCTYTVTVDGKTRTFDYNGFRAFLLKPKNLAAVAPSFAGQRAKPATSKSDSSTDAGSGRKPKA